MQEPHFGILSAIESIVLTKILVNYKPKNVVLG